MGVQSGRPLAVPKRTRKQIHLADGRACFLGFVQSAGGEKQGMTDTRNGRGAAGAFIVVTSLFFAWGFITSLIDPLIAAIKGIYSLSDREALLTQFAFFISYGLISVPAAFLLTKSGHVRTILISLGVMLAACLIILLATFAETYSAVLFGLFVMGSGITALQVAANPL